MTNHKQAAIEAGAHWLFADDTPCEENCACALSQTEAENVLNTMLPHLREMIAQEIRAEIKRQGPATDRDQNLYLEGLGHAALIAKGPQR